jgi:hypothetical protein
VRAIDDRAFISARWRPRWMSAALLAAHSMNHRHGAAATRAYFIPGRAWTRCWHIVRLIDPSGLGLSGQGEAAADTSPRSANPVLAQ